MKSIFEGKWPFIYYNFRKVLGQISRISLVDAWYIRLYPRIQIKRMIQVVGGCGLQVNCLNLERNES
jgi:hypothetical protein